MLSLIVAFQIVVLQDASRPDAVKTVPHSAMKRAVTAPPVDARLAASRNRLIQQEAAVDGAFRNGSLPYADWAKVKRELADAHLELALAEVGQSNGDLRMLDLQRALDHANRIYQVISNIMKARQDTAKAVIKNVR